MKKDEKPYIIFLCSRCKQYSYVKQTQKTKKCLRCGKIYQVKNITDGIIVNGINKTLDTVKEKQNYLVYHKLGSYPDFHTTEEFLINMQSSTMPPTHYNKKDIIEEKDNYEQFKLMLKNLSKKLNYNPKRRIPDYLIKLEAEEYHIQKKNLKIFISKALRDGFLNLEKNNYYIIRF